MTRTEAEKRLKELEANKLRVWPAHNTNTRNQVAGIPPDSYALVSKCDLAAAKQWLREVDVADFDQSTYAEGTKPKKAKGDAE